MNNMHFARPGMGAPIAPLIPIAISGLKSLLGAFGGGGDDRADTFIEDVMPAALQVAKSENAPVFAFWYGLLIGVAPSGQLVKAGEVPDGAAATAALHSLANQYGHVIGIDSLSPFTTSSYFAGGVVAPGSGNGLPQTAMDGTDWLLWGGVAVAVALIIRKSR